MNPHTYGAGTRLSSAYTAGRDGLPCPAYCRDRTSAAYKAWAEGKRQREARERLAPDRSHTYTRPNGDEVLISWEPLASGKHRVSVVINAARPIIYTTPNAPHDWAAAFEREDRADIAAEAAREKLWDAHIAEAKRRRAGVFNFGKGQTGNGIYSTTSCGGLESTIDDAGNVTHQWTGGG